MPRWTPEEETFVLANRRQMTSAELGRRIGRTTDSVRNWISLNCGRDRDAEERVRAIVREHWPTARTIGEIASIARVRSRQVELIAHDLRLPPREARSRVIPRPRGFDPETVIWARMHRERSADAKLICAMVERPDGVARGVAG